MIVQRLKKELKNDTDVAYRYYSVLSALNDLELTEREIQLMSFIAVSGSISVPSNREKFCLTYKTTGATVNNMVSSSRSVISFSRRMERLLLIRSSPWISQTALH